MAAAHERSREAARPSPVRLLYDERGDTGMIEFLIAFPILLTLLALIAQFALLFVGQLVVEYASFNAARSAIVWIPAELGARGKRNVLSKEKKERIEGAAATSCAPLSPGIPLIPDLPKQDWFGGSLRRSVDTGGSGAASGLLAYFWSRVLTDVSIVGKDGKELKEKHVFGPADPITVRVEHRFYLDIPIAATLFSDWDFFGYGIKTKKLVAETTLLNQGRYHGKGLR